MSTARIITAEAADLAAVLAVAIDPSKADALALAAVALSALGLVDQAADVLTAAHEDDNWWHMSAELSLDQTGSAIRIDVRDNDGILGRATVDGGHVWVDRRL